MKTLSSILSFLFLFSISINAQDQSTPASKQIGLTGLPIFYLNNGAGNGGGFNGIALYGSFGWIIKEQNIVGLRPFFGVVDTDFSKTQRMHSLGSNVYYRRYLNEDRLRVFGEFNIGLGYLWYTSNIPNLTKSISEFDGIMFNYAFGLGADYEIKNGWNIELSFQYLQMKNISHPEDTNVGKTIIPSIGIQRFF